MDKQSVPQDHSPTYEGLRKLLYAVDENGNYTGVPSSGWEAESFSTELAVAEMIRQRDAAWQRARAGTASVLEYHMYRNRMDFDTLVMTTGIWRWRVRRHFKPQVFARLGDALLLRYASVMGISIETLKQLPDTP
jgi:nucleotide-binding universal stress UspA family protein